MLRRIKRTVDLLNEGVIYIDDIKELYNYLKEGYYGEDS